MGSTVKIMLNYIIAVKTLCHVLHFQILMYHKVICKYVSFKLMVIS